MAEVCDRGCIDKIEKLVADQIGECKAEVVLILSGLRLPPPLKVKSASGRKTRYIHGKYCQFCGKPYYAPEATASAEGE